MINQHCPRTIRGTIESSRAIRYVCFATIGAPKAAKNHQKSVLRLLENNFIAILAQVLTSSRLPPLNTFLLNESQRKIEFKFTLVHHGRDYPPGASIVIYDADDDMMMIDRLG